MDQGAKSSSLLKKVSSLEEQMSILVAKIAQLKEWDIYITEIIESACKQLQCKLPGAPECLLLLVLVRYILTLCFPGICLDPVVEDRRVTERTAALRGYLRIPTLSELMLIAIVPLFFCRIGVITLENPLTVVKKL
jgi:hypothetical protein